MRFAIAHPERVDALVGMSAATTFAPLLADATAELEELGDPVDVYWLRGFQEIAPARPRHDGPAP